MNGLETINIADRNIGVVGEQKLDHLRSLHPNQDSSVYIHRACSSGKQHGEAYDVQYSSR